MWRDRDPYHDPNTVPDTFWFVIAAVLFAASGLVWLIGQVAAILLGPHHQHLPVRLVDMLGVLLRLPGTWDDPAQAWPPSASRCSLARWACTPPPSLPSGSPPSSMDCWSGWSRPRRGAAAGNEAPSGPAGGSFAACSCWDHGEGGSSWAAATGFVIGSSAGCTWRSSSATRS
jgi:hypothetical protein